MKLLCLLILLFTPLASPGATPSGVWHTPDGTVLTETEARRSVSGFGVWLIATPDQDWQDKWNTPPSVTPHFTEASTVKRGGKLTILIVFSNPQSDLAGNASISCDIKVIRPDGSSSVDAPNLSCMDGPLLGAPANLRLGAPVIVVVAEPKDQTGHWQVQVRVRDQVRKVEVPVQTSFILSD
jgi:hypothetical protein